MAFASSATTYEDVYVQLLTKMRLNTTPSNVIFHIPVETRMQNYSPKTCAVFLMKKLRDQSIKVSYQSPNILIVEPNKEIHEKNEEFDETVKPKNPKNKRQPKKKPDRKITDSAIVSIIQHVDRYSV